MMWRSVLFACLLARPVVGVFDWTLLPATGGTKPPARDSAAAVWDEKNGRLVLFGGSDGRDDTWTYDLATNTWAEVAFTANQRPRGRDSMIYGLLVGAGDDQFVITTGQAENKDNLNDVWILDLTADLSTSGGWRELEPTGDIPAERYGSAGGIYRDQQFLMLSHGFDAKRFSDTFVLDFADGEPGVWRKTHGGISEYDPTKPHSRCLVGSAPLPGASVFMYGGCLTGGGTGGPCPSRDGWLYNEDDGWEEVEVCPSARTYASAAPAHYSATEVIMYGGKESSLQIIQADKASAEEIDVLNVVTEEWTRWKSTGDIPPKVSEATLVPVTARSFSLLFTGEDLYQLDGTPGGEEISGCGKWFTVWALHGLFMFLGWGVCLQAGAFIARYFRHRDPWWFMMHRRFQYAGVVLMMIGFFLGIISAQVPPATHFAFAHGGLGFVIMLLGFMQPVNAYFRPHHGEKWRFAWEQLHRWSGRLALVLALINISLGLFMALSPRGVWITWFVYMSLLVAAYVVFEVKKVMGGGGSKVAATSSKPE